MDSIPAKLEIAGIERVEVGPRLRNDIETGNEIPLWIEHTVNDPTNAPGAPRGFLGCHLVMNQAARRGRITVTQIDRGPRGGIGETCFLFLQRIEHRPSQVTAALAGLHLAARRPPR